ncbi:MAG TPA: hypothetical protein VF382_08185 [Actinomycetota bacterium]
MYTEEHRVADEPILEEGGADDVTVIADEVAVTEIERPVRVPEAPAKLPKEIEDGLRRSDVIYVGADANGKRGSIPSWFSYKNGRIYVLSQKERGPQEQTIPGIPGASEVRVITRRKATVPETRGRDTSLKEFRAVVRVLAGPDWEEAAKLLADRRRSRVGPPEDSIARWRDSCVIAELVPIVLV